jgi:hypothetical protein
MRELFLVKALFRGFFVSICFTLLHLPPLRSTESEDAGFKPRAVATSALAVRGLALASDEKLKFLLRPQNSSSYMILFLIHR